MTHLPPADVLIVRPEGDGEQERIRSSAAGRKGGENPPSGSALPGYADRRRYPDRQRCQDPEAARPWSCVG